MPRRLMVSLSGMPAKQSLSYPNMRVFGAICTLSSHRSSSDMALRDGRRLALMVLKALTLPIV